MSENMSCATYSLNAGEPLFGTAPRVDTWFLLEYTGRWEPKALEQSALPDAAKECLITHRDSLPNARVSFIRRQPRQTTSSSAWKLAFYVALVRESRPALYAFSLEQYEDLLAWDIPAICAEDTAYDHFKQRDPLLMVCTHGRRDPCCARQGLPVYERIGARDDATVWQTSHVGGHRFAANVIALPHGIYYGRVRPDTADAIVNAYRAGQLTLDTYRGRACYTAPVQAADYYLRTETGITDLDAFRLVSADQSDDTRWTVQFAATAGGDRYTLQLAVKQTQTYKNCSDAAPSSLTHFDLIELSGVQ
jgi:hypothetical protein